MPTATTPTFKPRQHDLRPPAPAWRVNIIKASKARKHTRIWAKGPDRQTRGWFNSVAEAQAFCDSANADLKMIQRAERRMGA